MPGILDLAQLAVDTALKAGAEWADAVASAGRSVNALVENTSMRECEVVRDCGIGVRAYFRGGMGSATSTALDEASARLVGEQAAEMAKATQGDPNFVALPDPQPWEEVPELWDDQVAGLAAQTVVEWCQEGIEEAKAVAPTVALSGGAGLDHWEGALASSTGVLVQRRGTDVSISFMAVIMDGDDAGAYFEFDAARRMTDFCPAGVAHKAATEALRFLGARHVQTARLPLVLGPMATSGFIGAIIAAANAEDIQRNRSYMAGKEGQAIGSPCLTVWEEPLVPAGLASAPVDGEGVPKVRRALIAEGLLTTYLHNSYTANKAKVANTAHAARHGFSPAVGIGVSNLQVRPGEQTEAELIADLDQGLYISYGALQPDAATGDISAMVDFGFKIEKGELAYPVKTTMIGSNVFEMLARLNAVSSDYRQEPGSIMPSLRFDDIMVAGGA